VDVWLHTKDRWETYMMDDGTQAMIETRSLAQQVYGYLCDAIRSGKFTYGETLSTKHLAEELHVSMMPIREALKRLEMDGIVEIRPRSQCLFRIPTKKTILNALDLRELLEIYCVEANFATLDSTRLEPLRRLTTEMETVLYDESIDLKKYIALDWRFHLELCNLADNEFIDRSYRELNIHLNMYYIYHIGSTLNVEQTFKDHIDLVEALSNHDARAVDIIRKHLHDSRKNITSGAFFQKQG